MKKPVICLMKVEKCEDCQHWEPIPFHDKGGECIPLVELPITKLFNPALLTKSKSKKVPVRV